MDWKLLLISVLGLLSASVDCSNEYWPTIPNGQQHPQSINYLNSNGGGLQGISPPQWQKSQMLAQNQQHTNLIVNDIPNQYLQPIQPYVLQGQKIPPNNFAMHQQVLYKTPQTYGGLPTDINPTERIPQQHILPHQNVNNAATDAWGNGQKLNQQNGNVEILSNPIVGQYQLQPYANYGNNFAYGYPQNQALAPLTSSSEGSYNNYYGKGWLPQNQYQNVPNPVGYSQWPETVNNYTPPKDLQYINNPYVPVSDNRSVEVVNPTPDQLQPGYQNANEQTVPLEQPVNVDQQIHKRYIIVHTNGSYEQVDNFSLNDIQNLPKHVLAVIEVEDKIADMENEKPFKPPFDEGISEIPRDDNGTPYNKNQSGTHQMYKKSTGKNTESQDSFANAPLPNDEIDMIYFKPEYLMPIQSTSANNIVSNDKTQSDAAPIVIVESGTDTNNRQLKQISTNSTDFTADTDYSITWTDDHTDSTIDSSYSTSENQIPILSSSENNKDAQIAPMTKEEHSSNNTNYYNPGYIIPQLPNTSETETTTECSKDTESPTTSSDYIDKSSTTHSSKCTQNCNNEATTTAYSEKGAKALDDRNQVYYNAGKEQRPLEVLPELTEETKVKSDGNSTSATYGDELIINISEYPENYPQPGYYDDVKSSDVAFTAQGEPITYQKEVSVTDAPKRRETMLRPDLEIDLSNLKTTIDKPIVWFRPDENFWDKVTKGENSFDFVTFYDVHCQPQLIEKHTTVHHFPNGTEVVEYVETFWKSANDLNPKEVKSNRVVKNPED